MLSLCSETVWDHSSVVNQCFVRDGASPQYFCTIVQQDQNGAVLYQGHVLHVWSTWE